MSDLKVETVEELYDKGYRTLQVVGAGTAQHLEQRLSNSTPNSAIRELIEKYDRSEHYSGKNYFDYECAYNDFRREIVKLLTNKEEG